MARYEKEEKGQLWESGTFRVDEVQRKKTLEAQMEAIQKYGMKVHEGFQKILTNSQTRLRRTSVEVFLGALMLGSLGGYLGHRAESARDKLLPVAFSEISQIKDISAQKGETVDPFTNYYAGLNDMTMKVFESWNDSWRSSKSDKDAYNKFAERLNESLMEHKYKNNLTDFLDSVPKDADLALRSLSGFIRSGDRMRTVNGHFSSAWKEHHKDNYHTELRTRLVTTTDADGNISMDTETYLESVYDDTTHTYTYNKNEGEAASVTLDKVLLDFQGLSSKMGKMEALKVQEPNRNAIRSSRKLKKGKDLTKGEYFSIASTWRTGSNFYSNRSTFSDPWSHLSSDASNWRRAKKTSRNHQYKTTSSRDAGPEEFRIARSALSHGQNFVNKVDEVVNGMGHAMQQTPVLRQKIHDFVGKTFSPSDYKNGKFDPKKEAYAIKDLASDLYQKNFKGGFDVKGYRVGAAMLYGLFGLLAGIGLGAAVDSLADKYQLWGKRTAGDYFGSGNY